MAVLACLAGWSFAGPSVAVEATGSWSHRVISGVARFMTETDRGDRFALWCRRGGSGFAPALEIRIGGRPPAPGQVVRIVVDRSLLKLQADSYGLVRIDCPACADQATWLWHRLRGGTFMQVLFDDGRYTGFSLRGAATTLGAELCKLGETP